MLEFIEDLFIKSFPSFCLLIAISFTLFCGYAVNDYYSNKKIHKYIIHSKNAFYFTNEYKIDKKCVKFNNNMICGYFEIEELKK